MNPKQLKYLSVFEEMARADMIAEATVQKYFPTLLSLDFAAAQEVWDYLASTRESELAGKEDAGRLLGGTITELFYKNSAQKTVKALADLPAVRRAVYQYSPVADEGTPFAVLVDLLVGGKVPLAEEIFKCLVRNDRVAYGPMMKRLLERVFIELLKKNPAKKLEMPRKLATLLLTYVSKIKTDERAMLEQRIRETM